MFPRNDLNEMQEAERLHAELETHRARGLEAPGVMRELARALVAGLERLGEVPPWLADLRAAACRTGAVSLDLIVRAWNFYGRVETRVAR